MYMLILGLGLNILNMDPDLPIQLRLSPRMFAENVSRGQHVGQESFEWGKVLTGHHEWTDSDQNARFSLGCSWFGSLNYGVDTGRRKNKTGRPPT